MQRTSEITRLVTVAATTDLLAFAVLAQSPGSKGGQEKTLTGIVSDNMCGATHMLKDKTPAELASTVCRFEILVRPYNCVSGC